MPELFLELFSEEIPARLQSRGAEELVRLVSEALAAIGPAEVRSFYGPRRIALSAHVSGSVAAKSSEERGPRITAPDAALAGFLRKHGASREAVRQDGDFWVLTKTTQAVDASALIAGALPGLLRRFAWPKSMRWGGTSGFTWIRPLRRILCLLDGRVVPFALAAGDDDGHGLVAGDLTEGHRLHAPGAVAVTGCADWVATLRARRVVADAGERAGLVRDGIASLCAKRGLVVVEDAGLVEEVAGLVEWPVPLLGRIDDAFMDLPPEVMQVSMRVNQRYFATRTKAGAPASWFAFAANLEAPDGGAAIVAGNERVLRARFSDARHFWDLDRRTLLADRVGALDGVTFQAELGTQGARVARIVRLAGVLAPLVGADIGLAERAALLCKADLTTGMVGEFPELQGVMGGYYAAHDGEDARVAAAVRDHYAPKGAGDSVPTEPVSVAVALADKLDQLVAFFAIGQKPTGSGDPYALRRAALGVIRIIRENGLRFGLMPVLTRAGEGLGGDSAVAAKEVAAFIVDRLRVQLRSEGARHDVLAAVFAAGADDDLTRALARTEAIAALLGTEDGVNLLAAYKRAANILRIEEKRDGPHSGEVNGALLAEPAEQALGAALLHAASARELLVQERFSDAMQLLAELRGPLDAFFETVTVNAEDAALRINRLRLLSSLRASLNAVADFSAVESV
jgi:glycyl-tRNA synthetase beta chain